LCALLRRWYRLGILNPHLASLLELNLAKSSSKGASSSAGTSVLLGCEEKNLAGSIKAELGIDCDAGTSALELIRGVRLHAEKMLKGMEAGDVFKAQLGLGHSYSRAKVKVRSSSPTPDAPASDSQAHLVPFSLSSTSTDPTT
jgi:RNA processing factor Prp31